MKSSLTGPGSMRLGGSSAVVDSQMTVSACPVDAWHHHVVRIVVSDSRPGGGEFDVVLSPEDAAHFASAVYCLAKVAVIKADHEAEMQAVAA